jgi:hypothetical protein
MNFRNDFSHLPELQRLRTWLNRSIFVAGMVTLNAQTTALEPDGTAESTPATAEQAPPVPRGPAVPPKPPAANDPLRPDPKTGVIPAIIPLRPKPEAVVQPLIEPNANNAAAPPLAQPVAEPAPGAAATAQADGEWWSAEWTDATPPADSEAWDFMPLFGDGGRTTGSGAFGASPDAWDGGFSGFASGLGMPPGVGGRLADGLSLAATLSGTYDTNPGQGYGRSSGSSGDSGGDFFTSLGGSASYRSKSAVWTYGLSYNGSYSYFLSESNLNGYNQGGGGSLNYESGPLNAGLNFGITLGSGANRYYASVVDQVSYNYGLNARYRLSGKTSLSGNVSQSFTQASGGQYSDTGSSSASLSALWRYSARTEFGPGIRYSRQSGSQQSYDRTTIGPMMTVNYTLTRKVSLNARAGLDFADYGSAGSGGTGLSASIGANYQATKLWGMNLSLNRDARASYTGGGFEEVTGLRLGYHRKIQRAAWTVGTSWESTTSANPEGVASGRPDRDYLSLDTALAMPIFADTCSGSVFLRYTDQSGGGTETWDSLQAGFSISRSF